MMCGKGLVERANGYLETSFMPGRTFTGPDDFNAQLGEWLPVANRRQHRILGARPAERWEADRAAMLVLPPVDPPHWWPVRTRIGRDHYIRLGTCDYSVHPRAIGRAVTVRSDTREVRVTTTEGEVVARHPRCWAAHQTLTDPEHAAAAAVMRADYLLDRRARGAAGSAAGCAAGAAEWDVEVEQRDLVSYDRVFTLIEGGAGKDGEAP
jgi:transposase